MDAEIAGLEAEIVAAKSKRQFINNTVVFTFHKESDRVKFDLSTDVFSKETFHPFTLDSTEIPDIALVAVKGDLKCLPSCCIQ